MIFPLGILFSITGAITMMVFIFGGPIAFFFAGLLQSATGLGLLDVATKAKKRKAAS